ncbi:hypothetical protein BZARG_2203 [Bizionia argentinensis JUB59]|uniref:Tail specific protease domain-containing protein n=1 Tax=Bizionia argentinensis JUB59 TaxID=1046627 RepID=G2EG95_9FLAO|nr:S41 family peptidase [Bizionia argentinensis]EGV42511.1 hypothetical protein BZARG_2203 [Bizionia argentinensis JUB59]
MKINILLIIILLSNICYGQEKWLIKSPNSFDYYITTEIKNGEIIGQTRNNALKDIVGGFKFTMAKMATSVKYPEIVYFKGHINANVFDGNFQMIFSQKKFKGLIKNDSILITLIEKDSSETKISGIRIKEIKPIRDYKKTFNQIFTLTENNIYNQSFLKSKDWRKFKKRMLKLSGDINDDLELQIAFSAFARDFPFSHYYLYKSQPENDKGSSNPNFANISEINSETCVLKVKSFSGSKGQMDSLISVIENKKYRNLIIDLRDNPGGNHLSAFPLAEYIIDKPIIAGVFPNKNWYKEFDRIPNKVDYSKFTEFSGGTMNEWFDKANQNYGAYFKVIPSNKHFNGKVFILTNNRTGSTCEPFVYGLKFHNYATIIGEHTAGAMLSSNEFNLDNGITLRIPLNDYITYSGERIDKNGIEPNIKVESEKALEYTLNKITVGNNVYKK